MRIATDQARVAWTVSLPVIGPAVLALGEPERSFASAPSPRAPQGDIAPRHWRGGAIDCLSCEHRALRDQPEGRGCEPGHACVQDAYARRIDRFLRWHPGLADAQLAHPYFEVRAIAARQASVFALRALVDDPDETVRLQAALRLPQAWLERLMRDPHREVRLRVAMRVQGAALAAMRSDPDYGVRERVAQRLPEALLPTLMRDPDRSVRLCVAQRLSMPALLAMVNDAEPEVRWLVAQRLPAALLAPMVGDEDWRVRWEVARRGDIALAARLAADGDPEVRQAARRRLDGPALMAERTSP